MKLLFPIFASLMLQYQVNTEFIGLRRCLMGLGRCRDHCNVDEKEIQKCKMKKCCVGPKVVKLIKNYLQYGTPNVLNEDVQEMLKPAKNSSAVIQRKHILSVLPQIKSTSFFANTNFVIIPNATPMNSATISTMTPGQITYTATSTKSNTKESRDSATASPPPAPPPPNILPTPSLELEEAEEQ
ncbi:DEFB129 isoform 1 [Pan troglodytes]|uniref:Beta-defensin 129 n=4 Tax=Homininae TaxID=207598 RepID=DB129_HUMAN|eukprot:NP_543021.1 beta-defensin 129 precursor [Homo sapiens]